MKKSIFHDHLLHMARQENQPLEKAVEFAANLGFVGADVIWSTPENLVETYELFKKYGIKIAEVSRFINLASDLDEKDVHDFLDYLSKCDCKIAMIIPQNKPDEDFSTVCSNIAKICGVADEYNISVSVEDFDSAAVIIRDTNSIEKAFQNVPKLCHSLDTGNYAFFKESPIEAYKLFRDRIIHVHLKDRSFSPTDNENPMPLVDTTTAYPCALGDGFVEIESVLKMLAKDGYNGYLSVEHFGMNNMKKAIEKSSEYLDGILSKI